MDQIANATEEIQNSASYSNIRFYKVGRATSDQEESDIVGGSDKWFTPDDATQLASFSAVCFLTARELTDLMGDDKRVRSCINQMAYIRATLVKEYTHTIFKVKISPLST